MLIEEVAESLEKVPMFQFPDATLSQIKLKAVKPPIAGCMMTSRKKGEIRACYRSFQCVGCTIL